jgi:hypothetical protein
MPLNGRYEMIVPARRGGESQVHAVEPYLISSGVKSRFVDVGEDEVILGGEIAVDLDRVDLPKVLNPLDPNR